MATVFSRPRTPAAKCLHLVRVNQIVTRSELVEATGLSQPTITRAITALIGAGLVHERTDLTRSQGRGRPTVPLELTNHPALHAGIAVGTSTTYIGLFDTRGRTIRDAEVPTPVAELTESDFIEHVMAGLNRLTAGLERPLASVGVTTSGRVTDDGIVDAPNLGWHGVDFAGRLRYQFSVPVVVSAAVPAILGSEIQSAGLLTGTMALFADDSIGAAVADDEGVAQIDLPLHARELTTAGVLGDRWSSISSAVEDADARPLLDARACRLAQLTTEVARGHDPATIVVAGSAFIDDPAAPKLFASEVRSRLPDVQLRLIPTHREVVRAIARAVALDQTLREPLALYA
ncbi:ROK family transcriptional regulator [Corynebacterium hylobatis]|uniref:ROK family transcriptional regulator n=1 Tax=Corynebacterium hylobatis TaxID=1859290 RepID=A0A3S0AWI8_9CORY|nr:ROK family protein [Corynebacterium hylobatis]RSZ63799.1 ROK family transcriptional regulator [Corynebacterium hylobatis]